MWSLLNECHILTVFLVSFVSAPFTVSKWFDSPRITKRTIFIFLILLDIIIENLLLWSTMHVSHILGIIFKCSLAVLGLSWKPWVTPAQGVLACLFISWQMYHSVTLHHHFHRWDAFGDHRRFYDIKIKPYCFGQNGSHRENFWAFAAPSLNLALFSLF